LRQHHAHVVADFPRLRKRLHSRAGLLSGGEQQMLAPARGLMAKPRLLLLDEPSLGLAPAVVDDLFAALDRLQSEQAMSLLLTLSDRAYVIESGRSLPPVPGRDRRGGRVRAGLSRG
jgi:branched-chain amino acid transport system ATP-binding protein